MNQVPDFWRTEVWHPLSVHFPIVLLVFAMLGRVLFNLLRGLHKSTWLYISRLMLFAGVVAAWVGIYTGNLADGIVSRAICDPTVLKAHENAAYTMAWLFTAAAGLELLKLLLPVLQKWDRWRELLLLALLLLGTGYLVYSGHLGASVVYQQGGGVYQPSADCLEFEQ